MLVEKGGCRKFRATFVFTVLLKGGLNQMIFIWRFVFGLAEYCN